MSRVGTSSTSRRAAPFRSTFRSCRRTTTSPSSPTSGSRSSTSQPRRRPAAGERRVLGASFSPAFFTPTVFTPTFFTPTFFTRRSSRPRSSRRPSSPVGLLAHVLHARRVQPDVLHADLLHRRPVGLRGAQVPEPVRDLRQRRHRRRAHLHEQSGTTPEASTSASPGATAPTTRASTVQPLRPRERRRVRRSAAANRNAALEHDPGGLQTLILDRLLAACRRQPPRCRRRSTRSPRPLGRTAPSSTSAA